MRNRALRTAAFGAAALVALAVYAFTQPALGREPGEFHED